MKGVHTYPTHLIHPSHLWACKEGNPGQNNNAIMRNSCRAEEKFTGKEKTGKRREKI